MSTAVIACGALAFDVRSIASRRGWEIEVVPVSLGSETAEAFKPSRVSPEKKAPPDVRSRTS